MSNILTLQDINRDRETFPIKKTSERFNSIQALKAITDQKIDHYILTLINNPYRQPSIQILKMTTNPFLKNPVNTKERLIHYEKNSMGKVDTIKIFF